MSTPTRSPLAEEGKFPDPEVLGCDILAAVTVNGESIGPERVDTNVDNLTNPCILCYVPPGRRSLGKYGDLEESFLYVRAFAEDRPTMHDMLVQARTLFDDQFRHGGQHKGVNIFQARESAGPAQLPQQPDAPRAPVESGFVVKLRRHQGPTVHP